MKGKNAAYCNDAQSHLIKRVMASPATGGAETVEKMRNESPQMRGEVLLMDMVGLLMNGCFLAVADDADGRRSNGFGGRPPPKGKWPRERRNPTSRRRIMLDLIFANLVIM